MLVSTSTSHIPHEWDEARTSTLAFSHQRPPACAPISTNSRLCNASAKESGTRTIPARFHRSRSCQFRSVAAEGFFREHRAAASTSSAFPRPLVITYSETNDLYLDAPEFEPFWAECAKASTCSFFVHPGAQDSIRPSSSTATDTAALGRPASFSLVMADDPGMINCRRVRPATPNLTIQHVAISAEVSLGALARPHPPRIRTRTSGARWATPRHGMKPEKKGIRLTIFQKQPWCSTPPGFCRRRPWAP